MIICRTPFRISFFGGGTDYPSWYRTNGGSVLSTTIDKYCYITLRHLPPFFDHNLRIVYSQIENCRCLEEIKHPAVRETLRFLNLDKNLEIHYDGDLPARSGIGSSSSFTVGLLNALYCLQGESVSKKRLARESIHIEQALIKETVGSQDQVAAAYGGLNHITFGEDDSIRVQPVLIPTARKKELNAHLMLFYSGITRTASEIAQSYVGQLAHKRELLLAMREMVERGLALLQGNGCLSSFGRLLHEAWMAKRSLSDKVTNTVVDHLYQRAMENGALGGKVTGAGGGGFLLFFVPPDARERVRQALRELIHVPFRIESRGSEILFSPSQALSRGNPVRHRDEATTSSQTRLRSIGNKGRS